MVCCECSVPSSFYGVHTLQEFQQAIREVHLNQAKGIHTVLILGSIPVRVGISLSFLRHVIFAGFGSGTHYRCGHVAANV